MRRALFERFAWIRDKARGCAVSPDARWVAVTHDDRLAVYERATQREACAWRRGGRQVRAGWCDADEGEFLALVDLHRGDVAVARSQTTPRPCVGSPRGSAPRRCAREEGAAVLVASAP